MAIIGSFLYYFSGGTIEKLIICYFIFMIINMFSTLSLHRWLTHRQILPKPFFRFFLYWTIIQVPNLIKPFNYVIAHRAHHLNPDKEGDPHPQSLGFFWLLIGKFNPTRPVSIKDLIREKELVILNRYFYYFMILNWLLIFIIDSQIFYIMWSIHYLRGWTFVVLNNYFGHGGKNMTPTNMPFWTVIFFLGEQLHKNHHDNPVKFCYESVDQKYNLDLTYYLTKYFVNSAK
jgi:fatty-acid desaturase